MNYLIVYLGGIVSGLMKSAEYIDLLVQAHPALRISTFSGLPSFVARLSIYEALDNALLRFFAKYLQNFLPTLLNPRTLFLGVPFEPYDQTASLTHVVSSDNYDDQLIKHAEMLGVDLLVIPNIQEQGSEIQWAERGYLSLPSFPDMVLDTQFESFESYLATLSQGMRSSIRRNQRRFKKAAFSIEQIPPECLDVQPAYWGYCHFFERARVKWYPHTPSYFSLLPQAASVAKVWVATANKKQIGFIIAFHDDKGLHAGRIGILPDLYRQHAIYFNLVYELIAYAIKNRIERLYLEPTNYRFKASLGARQVSLVHFVKGFSNTWRYLLKYHGTFGNKLLSHLRVGECLEKY